MVSLFGIVFSQFLFRVHESPTTSPLFGILFFSQFLFHVHESQKKFQRTKKKFGKNSTKKWYLVLVLFFLNFFFVFINFPRPALFLVPVFFSSLNFCFMFMNLRKNSSARRRNFEKAPPKSGISFWYCFLSISFSCS